MIKAKLVVVGGDAKAAEIALSLPTVIGRGREASLTLPHPLVSRQHCELFEKDGLLHVRDMKSLNGTYVDSHRIEASSALNPDQLLTIGNVTFRAVYSLDDSSIAKPKPDVSNVIEFDEFNASADSDSEIDGGDVPSDGNRNTEPAPAPSAPSQKRTVAAGDKLQTISADDISRQFPDSSEVLPGSNESPQQAAEHSIVAALQQAGVEDLSRDRASMSDLMQQLPADASPETSGLDGLVIDSDQAPAEAADFSTIDIDDIPKSKIESDESALGSFIRKLPR